MSDKTIELTDHGLGTDSPRDQIQIALERIMKQREQIVEAFIAEYGLPPSQVEQVTEYRTDKTIWYLRKKGTE